VVDHLQLHLFLPDSDQSVCASLAVVRWVQATLFGVEFLKIDEKYRSRLNQFVAMGSDQENSSLTDTGFCDYENKRDRNSRNLGTRPPRGPVVARVSPRLERRPRLRRGYVVTA